MPILTKFAHLGAFSILSLSLQFACPTSVDAASHQKNDFQTPLASRSFIAASGWIDDDIDDDDEDDMPATKPNTQAKSATTKPTTTSSQPAKASAKQSQSAPKMSSSLKRGTPYDGRPQRGLKLWGNIDYLLFWTSESPIGVPLITSGSSADRFPGALGDPGTKILYNKHDVNYGAQSGFRAALRTWFDDSKKFGLELSGLLLPKQLHTHTNYGDPNTFLGVPINNISQEPHEISGGWNSIARTGEGSILISHPANPHELDSISLSGHITVRTTTELWDSELNGLYNFFARDTLHLSALAGLLYVDLRDTLSLHTYSIPSRGGGIEPLENPPIPNLLNGTTADHFLTHNAFFGGQLGLEGEWTCNWFFTRVIGKVGLGSVYQSVEINGHFGDPDDILFENYGQGPGGIFAQATNSGHRHKYRFAVVPEAFLQVGVNILKNLRIGVGYNFLYISSVVRAGDQIDRTINETQAGPNEFYATPTLVGPARPKPLHHTTYYWAQGINIGIEFRY